MRIHRTSILTAVCISLPAMACWLAANHGPVSSGHDPHGTVTSQAKALVRLLAARAPAAVSRAPAPQAVLLASHASAAAAATQAAAPSVPASVRSITPPSPDTRAWLSFSGQGSMAPPSVDPQIEKRADGYRIVVDLPGIACEPRQVEGTMYAELQVPGWSLRQETGKPAIPIKTLMLEIPPGVRPVVQLTAATEIRLAPLTVLPAQPPYLDVRPEPPRPSFRKDAQTYASAAPWPASNVIKSGVEQMRNRRILVLELTPVRVCSAAADALVAEHLEVQVAFERMPNANSGAGAFAPADEEVLPEAAINGAPAKYMILMNDQFTNNPTLAEFVDWKKRKGCEVNIVKTSAIDPSGAPTNGQIVAYMRNLPATNYPEYLLIIGDQTATNGVEGTYMITDQGGWTDLDIARRNTNDYIADCFHGRIPAPDNDTLALMLGKALAMDRHPPTNAIYQKVCVAGMLQDAVHSNVAERLFCETSDLVASYFEQSPGGVPYACVRAVVNPDGVDSNCFWNPQSILWNHTDRIGSRVFDLFIDAAAAHERITNQLNQGIALIQHRDHGYADGSGWADPALRTAHVLALTNGNLTPVVFSINCASGAYHYDRFLRAWLKNPNGGAYAVFAPVDISYSWYNDWLTHGFYAAFLTNYISFQNTCTTPAWSKHLPAPSGAYGTTGNSRRLGEILNFGKLYMRQNYGVEDTYTTFALFHLFGDPEAHIQLLTPATQNVGHPATLLAGVPTTIVVSNLPADSLVCLYSPDLGIQRVTNAAGNLVSFSVTAAATGTIYVTVTRYATQPYEGSILVRESSARPGSANYDGDRKADPAIYNESTGTWKVFMSSAEYTPVTMGVQLGGPGYSPVTGDYDGDRLADPAIYNWSSGVWSVMLSSAGYSLFSMPAPLGGLGFAPAPADFDGDRLTDPAIYDNTTGNWSVLLSSGQYQRLDLPGLLGDMSFVAAPADYDGDNSADPAVCRVADGLWIILLSGSNYFRLELPGLLGGQDVIPASADYDGDGKADPAVANCETGEWRMLLSGSGYAMVVVTLSP